MRENNAASVQRWEHLKVLQTHYKEFDVFLHDVMQNVLGFHCTDIQKDIGKFLVEGGAEIMVQAQRGQAKTTITAIFSVWSLIHNPWYRIVILSAGGSMAEEISTLIIQIINTMDVLECLRPDLRAGDRSSVKAFDIHHSLKGVEKSPSVASIGITGNLQGKRADLLIADDIESQKNSQTMLSRERLLQLTRDFTSICSKGRIIYLGTPQSVDSIYNSLPSRGYNVRIWTGRYPTFEEEKNYGGCLAPIIVERMQANPELRTGGGALGNSGQAVDPLILDEEFLTKKELDQGRAFFKLQFMLDTALMDQDRFPLKLNEIIFMNIPKERTPLEINWSKQPDKKLFLPPDYPVREELYEVYNLGSTWDNFKGTHMYIDPSGGGKNGDEFAVAVSKYLSGYVYIVDVQGLHGGLNEDNRLHLLNMIQKWKPHRIDFEENFGGTTLRNLMLPYIYKIYNEGTGACVVEGVYEKGQKELRIIEVLEPLISSNRLIIEKDLVKSDWLATNKYSIEKRKTYSLFFQMSRLTRDRKSLVHDDKLDALAGTARYWREQLVIDKDRAAALKKQEEIKKLMLDPFGNGKNYSWIKKEHKTIFERFK